MVTRREEFTVRCFVEGRAGHWSGICLDLDLATQGESFEEVDATLRDMIQTYLETAFAAPPRERRTMLSRKVPWPLRWKYAAKFGFSYFFARKGGNDQHSFIAHQIREA